MIMRQYQVMLMRELQVPGVAVLQQKMDGVDYNVFTFNQKLK